MIPWGGGGINSLAYIRLLLGANFGNNPLKTKTNLDFHQYAQWGFYKSKN